MQAIRVRKRAGGYTVHWLLDASRTYCGRKPAELDVVDELELERLPSVEACRGCERAVDGWTPQAERASEAPTVTLPPSLGTLRTSGSLSHGTRRRGSRRLA